MNIIIVVYIVYIVTFISILRYIVLYLMAKSSSPMLINKKLYCHTLSKDGIHKIRGKHFPKPYKGTNYTFNFWLFLENVPENACRDSTITHFIDIFIMENTKSYLKLQINQYSSDLKLLLCNNTSIDDSKQEHTIINHIPNQKWVNISINIENKYIDVYFNGMLYNSFYSPNIITFITPAPMKIICSNKGFYGYISKLRFFDTSIDYKRVNELYNNNMTDPGSNKLLWWLA